MSNPFHDGMDATNPEAAGTVIYVCEHCGGRFEADEALSPRAVDCPHCGEETILGVRRDPEPEPEPEPEPKPELEPEPATKPEPEPQVTVEPAGSTKIVAPEPAKHGPVTVNVVSAPGRPEQQQLPAPQLKPGGALIECPDCGGVMSRRAEVCAICGRPRRTRPSVFYYVFVGTVSFALTMAFLCAAAFLLLQAYFPAQHDRLVAAFVSEEEDRSAPPLEESLRPGAGPRRAAPPPAAATDPEAAETFRRALKKAEAGDRDAQHYVGYCYYVGQGVPQDDHKAFSWYFKAALQGSAQAQSNLASMFVEGRGVPQDYNEALRYYKKAADQGLAEAQFNLGVLYDKGMGVTQNYKEAFRWYYLAADNGDVNAQLSVAMMHFQGQGANLDLVQALKWAILASSQGHEGAEELRRALTESDRALMPDQIAQAQREASEFMEQKKAEKASGAKG